MIDKCAAVAGVDIGGTFTDIIIVTEDGRVEIAKVLSTPANYSDAILNGLAAVLAPSGLAGSDLERVVHGTTVASNAVLEGTAAAPALVTTRGFRDVIEIGRLRLPKLYDVAWRSRHRWYRAASASKLPSASAPTVRWSRCSMQIRLPRSSPRSARPVVGSVAISLINAFANPVHEQALRRMFADRLPEVDVTVGSELSRQIREVERTSTAVVNAYLRPVLRGYLDDLAAVSTTPELPAPSSSASRPASDHRRASQAKPVAILESGPAAGVVGGGGARRGSRDRQPDQLRHGRHHRQGGLDRGRCLCADFRFHGRRRDDHRLALLTGAGHPLQVPAIDLAEVGAGGGSIIRRDAGGGLLVGPASAGAAPGPACYGRGGKQPTITDAAAALGYLNRRDSRRCDPDRRCRGASRASPGDRRAARDLGGRCRLRRDPDRFRNDAARPSGGLVGARPRSPRLRGLRFRRQRAALRPASG